MVQSCATTRLPDTPLLPNCVTLFEDPTLGPLLCTAHVAASALTLTFRPHPAAAAPPTAAAPPAAPATLRVPTALPPAPVALLPHGDALLLATRAGELFAVDPAAPAAAPVGEISHPDPALSGVLAAAASPDGALAALVSPLHTTLLDASHDLVAEVSHPAPAATAAAAWRADGAALAVVTRAPTAALAAAVFDRAGAARPLHLPAVPPGPAPPVAWQPRAGGMLALAASGPRLSFFERNGLRHLRSDFALWAGDDAPRALAWSTDGRVLATVRAGPEGVSDLYLHGRANYHWYCRKRLRVPGRVVALAWDEDCAGRLWAYAADGGVVRVTLRTVPATVGVLAGRAYGVVVDGCNAILTNFSHAIVPPPMNHGVFELNAPLEEVCFWEAEETVGALLADGQFETLRLAEPWCKAQVECVPKPGGDSRGVRRRWNLDKAGLNPSAVLPFRSPVMVAEDILLVVCRLNLSHEDDRGEVDTLRAYRLDPGDSSAVMIGEYIPDSAVRAMSRSAMPDCTLSLITSKGSVVHLAVDFEAGDFLEVQVALRAVSCTVTTASECIVSGERVLTLVHDENGLLSVIDVSTGKTLVITAECSSYVLHEGFLSFTTTSHLLYCTLLDKGASKSYQADRDDIPSLVDAIDNAPDGNKISHLPEGKGATRPVDRGSLIVTAIPGDVSIVLQAPRGNLETICPRPVVFEAVDRYAKSADYANGFQLCRRQRVDMNHLVDADYNLFLENIEKFVQEVGRASHLSVFMTFLRGEKDKVNSVCDAIVQTLKESDESVHFTNAITTGLTRREPPDFDGALDQVRMARRRSEEEGSAALDYLFVLVKNEEKVYEYALGTYDLSLALFVARSSQMDPAEYSPELKAFSTMEETRRKHAIDMRLERYDRALRHLHACGEDTHKACVVLCHDHGLYEMGLSLFRADAAITKQLLHGYGRQLDGAQRYGEAAAAFARAGDLVAAHRSYRAGGLWELAAAAAARADVMPEKRDVLLEQLAEELVEGGQPRAAATVRLQHLGDASGAADVLVVAEEWDAAFAAAGAPGGEVWQAVAGAVTEGAAGVLSTLRENAGKLHERCARLSAVRAAKATLARTTAPADGSDAFSESSATSLGSRLSDVTFGSRSAATSVYSTAASAVTGPLTAARLEKVAERRRRKRERKRVREGHPREEEALVAYLRKLAPTEFLAGRVERVGRALLFLGEVAKARELVEAMRALVAEALLLPDDVLAEEDRRRLEKARWEEAFRCIEFL